MSWPSSLPSLCPDGETKAKSDMADFRKFFAEAKHIVIISGAGVSAESGVPTFRGAGGYWRKWQAQDLATPQAFARNPSRVWEFYHYRREVMQSKEPNPGHLAIAECEARLGRQGRRAFARNPSRVWEFYHYRREVMQSKEPNPGHLAIAECEARLGRQGRRVTVITQNIDELHRKAGTKNLLEIHVACLFNIIYFSAPEPETQDAKIPVEKLPRCEEEGCGGLLRPHVVWFGENLDPDVLEEVDRELALCDLCLVVGTSSVVYPAAMFAPQVSARGVPVAEFNTETTPATNRFRDKTLLKEKRKRREELFIEQKKRKLLPDAILEKLTAAPQTNTKKSPGKLQEVNKFLSLANKRLPVKKAAVQFLNTAWGAQKKQNAKKFKRRWMIRKMKTSKK
ncbi:NAD-dependent deacetylase sirtuin-5 [Tupaia chinensis]|uniref:NAD-dependent protein deacylase sirtuin-5, mitochondrial n=1 Tax=Tupaia chinensis TaxID=246437 RepID=L9LAM3_TUPCH|nr:NAD-dependent deacetylase sirtuin-5 [Tupaia chinensis]